MMSYTSHLHEGNSYLSQLWIDSESHPGVSFAIRKASLGGRLALNERLCEITRTYEFLRAGDALENAEATLADLLAQRLYIEWGLVEIKGLTIDHHPASAASLIDSGPEALAREIVCAIRASLELSESERKNS